MYFVTSTVDGSSELEATLPLNDQESTAASEIQSTSHINVDTRNSLLSEKERSSNQNGVQNYNFLVRISK